MRDEIALMAPLYKAMMTGSRRKLQTRLGHESLATTGIYVRALSSDENRHADRIAAMLGIE